jgi:hypothetical protein
MPTVAACAALCHAGRVAVSGCGSRIVKGRRLRLATLLVPFFPVFAFWLRASMGLIMGTELNGSQLLPAIPGPPESSSEPVREMFERLLEFPLRCRARRSHSSDIKPTIVVHGVDVVGGALRRTG